MYFAFDPTAVTPGPIGFLATLFLFASTGLLAIFLMNKISKYTARERVLREMKHRDFQRSNHSQPANQQPADSQERY